jgi:hypothetical protein
MVGAWVVMLLTWLYVVAATVFSLWPGLLTSGVLDKASGVDRGPFEITVFVTMAIIIGVGVVFYFIGKGHAVHDRWHEEGAPAQTREPAGVRRT